jgi:hypothetical protein
MPANPLDAGRRGQPKVGISRTALTSIWVILEAPPAQSQQVRSWIGSYGSSSTVAEPRRPVLLLPQYPESGAQSGRGPASRSANNGHWQVTRSPRRRAGALRSAAPRPAPWPRIYSPRRDGKHLAVVFRIKSLWRLDCCALAVFPSTVFPSENVSDVRSTSVQFQPVVPSWRPIWRPMFAQCFSYGAPRVSTFEKGLN